MCWGTVGAPVRSRVRRALLRSDQQENSEGGVVHQQGVRELGVGVEGGIHRTVRSTKESETNRQIGSENYV